MEQLGRLETAGEYYSAGVQANPSYAWAYHRLGLLAEDPFRAVEFLEEAVAADSSFSQAWIDLGLACEDTGDLYRAAEAFRKSLEHNPSAGPGGAGMDPGIVGAFPQRRKPTRAVSRWTAPTPTGGSAVAPCSGRGGDDNAAWRGSAWRSSTSVTTPGCLGSWVTSVSWPVTFRGATGFFARAVQASRTTASGC